MSTFEDAVIQRIRSLEREVERLQRWERPIVITDHGALAGLGDDDHPQYLLATGKAADSDKLDGNDSTYFMPQSYKDGWIPVSNTWTYNAANKINVPSGATSIYTVGMGIRLTANSVVKQAYIVKVENTLLTVAGDALTNHTFSAISYTPTPATAMGFPNHFTYTPSLIWAGGTTDPTSASLDVRYVITGKWCTVAFNAYIIRGSGDRNILYFSLPISSTVCVGGSGASSLAGYYATIGGFTDGANFTVLINQMSSDGNIFMWVNYEY